MAMEAAVNECITFFKDFLNMCLQPSWPDKTTRPESIRQFFLTTQHIEKLVSLLKYEQNCFNEFLTLLVSVEPGEDQFLKICLEDPPKYVLKKIINSEDATYLISNNMSQIEVAFREFQEIFSKERLITSLSDLMVETASKDTLLKFMDKELPKHKLLHFNCMLYLLELRFKYSTEDIVSLLLSKDCEQVTVDTLVLCLLKDHQKFGSSIEKIEKSFSEVMSCRDSSASNFWMLLFNVEKTNFVQICLKYDDLCMKIFEALKDCYIHKDLQSPHGEYYINLTSQQLMSNIEKINENNTLKLHFSDYMRSNDFESFNFD